MDSAQTGFSVTYDLTTRLVTALVVTIAIFAVVALHSVAAGAIAALVIVLAYAYSPRGYVIADQTLTIKRMAGNIRLPLDSVREVRLAGGDDLKRCMRLWASGGLFGYYGLFRTRGLGTCTWYVTNRSKSVVLITGAKTVVLSPDDPNGFVTALHAFAPASELLADGPLFQTLDVGSSRGSGFAGIAIGAAAIAIAAAAMLYSPGAPPYTLTPDSLTIHDRFYPVTVDAATVDIPGIRIVDIDVDKEWQATKRTNGFGNPHYHAGWFEVASGKKVRMYRADSRRLVLLPPKGGAAPVLYEVKDPDQFVQELRRQWAGHATVANRF